MHKNEFNVFDSTVKYDHCIGCGICDASCPDDAINMTYTKYKEIVPVINDNCTNCKICVAFCPHTNDKINKTMQQALNFNNPHLYGIDIDKVFVAHDLEDSSRNRSASGGALTATIKGLLDKGIIEYVIHANMKSGVVGDVHYSATISSTTEELDHKRGSFYAPISFEKQIKQFYDKNNKLLIVGVPCVTRGIKKLFTKNKYYKKNTVYTAALACSHNVNGQFVDFLAQSEKISKHQNFKANLRNKDDIKDANHFKNHFFNNNNSLVKKDRFQTQFTTTWRNYYFSSNICFKCSDFFGKDADVSVKDAWGKWANSEPRGQTIMMFKNNLLLDYFLENKDISKQKIGSSEVSMLQNQTTLFKHKDIKNRINKKVYSLKNIKNGYFRKYITSKLSKFLYKNLGFKPTNLLMKNFEKLINMFNIIKKLMPVSLVKIFYYKKQFKMHRIFIVGGYGYSNTGDEAQLNNVLFNLNKYFPSYFKIVGTHNRTQTFLKHQHSTLFDSPREAFFEHNSCSTYGLNSKLDSLNFFVSSVLIYLNAFLVRAELPTFFINSKKSALLNELRNCDLLYFCGGGYLTGDTLSRLYDGILMIHLAKIFDIKIVLSGQTIGLWNNNFNRFLAKHTFNKVDLLTTRDPKSSLSSLKEIGVNGDHIYHTCDDALFSPITDDVSTFLEASSYYNIDEKFITFNIHYWGMNNKGEKVLYLNKILEIINFILENTNLNIILIPMVKTDEDTINDFLELIDNDRLYKFCYNYDFKVIRTIIKQSKVCVTMKHHPIIFALGESVPVISLYYTDYYFHKNNGALELFDADEFNVDISKDNYLTKFIEKYEYIDINYSHIKNKFKIISHEVKIKQETFYDKVQRLI